MSSRRLLVLGASGGCGRWVVRLAARRGHHVTAVVRPGARLEVAEGVRVVRGLVTDPPFLRSVLKDHRVVVSCLGLRRAGKAPWSRLKSPADLVQRVTRHVLEEVSDPRATHLIWISAGGVGSSRTQVTRPVGWLIRSGNVGVAYRDLESAERLLQHAPLQSLAVRPVTLLPGGPTGNAGPVRRYGLASTIRRADVASWMLDVADGTRAFDGDHVLLGRVRR